LSASEGYREPSWAGRACASTNQAAPLAAIFGEWAVMQTETGCPSSRVICEKACPERSRRVGLHSRRSDLCLTMIVKPLLRVTANIDHGQACPVRARLDTFRFGEFSHFDRTSQNRRNGQNPPSSPSSCNLPCSPRRHMRDMRHQIDPREVVADRCPTIHQANFRQ
jgi:hypothetical protein